MAPLPVPAVSAVGVAPLRVQARSPCLCLCVDLEAVDSSRAAGDLARGPVAAPLLVTCVRGFARSVVYCLVNVGLLPRGGGRAAWSPALVSPQGEARRGLWPAIVTWLILPVVICLSQRLSHACLSINDSIL